MIKWRLDAGQIEVVDDAVAEVLRHHTLTERVSMVLAANRTMRLIIEGRLRTSHPDWDDRRIAAEVARRMGRGPG
jgi:Arc/MetJ family transcription regulator